MRTDRPDPNARSNPHAELHDREPLRIAFALTAPLLGLLAVIQI